MRAVHTADRLFGRQSRSTDPLIINEQTHFWRKTSKLTNRNRQGICACVLFVGGTHSTPHDLTGCISLNSLTYLYVTNGVNSKAASTFITQTVIQTSQKVDTGKSLCLFRSWVALPLLTRQEDVLACLDSLRLHAWSVCTLLLHHSGFFMEFTAFKILRIAFF